MKYHKRIFITVAVIAVLTAILGTSIFQLLLGLVGGSLGAIILLIPFSIGFVILINVLRTLETRLTYLKIRRLSNKLQTDSNNKVALFERGKAFYLLRNYHLAVEDWVKVLQLDKTNSEAYGGLGYAYYHLGDLEKAQRYFRQYIQFPEAASHPEIRELIDELGGN